MMADILQKTCLNTLGLCIFFAGPAVLAGEDSAAQSNQQSVTQSQNAKQQTRNRELTSDNEQLALVLTREHLPQLTPLLQQLKIDQPRQYERAVMDLARSAKKLNIALKKDERLYQVELELLKADTEANLIAAKLKVRDRPQDRIKLRDAVVRLHAAKHQKMRYDIEVLQQRLARDQASLATAEQNLSALTEDSSKSVDAVYLSLLRKADRKTHTDKTQKRTEALKKKQKANATSSE